MCKRIALLLILALMAALTAAVAEEAELISEPLFDAVEELEEVELAAPGEAAPAEVMAAEAVVPDTAPLKLILGKGEKYQLQIEGATGYKSSNKKVVTVSAKGVVTGIKAGKSATVTVTRKKGSAQKIKVTVKKAPKKVKLNKTKLTLEAGKTCQLKATLPSGTASTKRTWKSSKSSVAKVSGTGLVTAVKAGTAKITVCTFDSKVKAVCTVTVKDPTPSALKIGVAMPTDALMRWKNDGATIKAELKKAGYAADLRYANNTASTQVKQVEAMINDGYAALIIAPIDGSSLSSTLDNARDCGIPVIAYDRLLMGSDGVWGYVTFDNEAVGAVQGEYIRDALDLDNATGPFNIEFTAGDPGDRNARLFFDGAMRVLKPYINSGKLKVLSGQSTFAKAATQYWMPDNAQKRAETILLKYYQNAAIHAWLCSNDSTAQGVIRALEANYCGENWPIVTGQDCDIENVRMIIKGQQSMSVFKDTAVLAKQAVKMADQLLTLGSADVNDTKTYDNGATVVPAYLCKPGVVTANNYKSVLIDSGLYRAADLAG